MWVLPDNIDICENAKVCECKGYHASLICEMFPKKKTDEVCDDCTTESTFMQNQTFYLS